MDVDHYFIAQMFEEEVHSLLKNIEEKQPSNKIANPSKGQFLNFFFNQRYFQKRGCAIERIYRGCWSINCQE